MRRTSDYRNAWFASWPWAVVFLAAVIGLGALNYFLLVPLKQRALDSESVQLEHVADLIDSSVTALFREIEGALHEIEAYGASHPLGDGDDYLRMETQSITAIAAIAVRDAEGKIVRSSSSKPIEIDDGAPAFFARSKHVDAFARGDTGSVYYSRAMRSGNRTVIWVSQPDFHANGSLRQIISAAVDTHHIADRLMPVAKVHDDANTLVGRDLRVVARNPWIAELIGVSVADYPLYEALTATHKLGVSLQYENPLTKTKRIGMAQWLPNRQFIVSVSRPLDAVLASWWHSALIGGLGSLAVLSLVGLMWWITARETARQRTINEALRDSERRFRLLVDGVTDYAIYLLDPEGRVANWNQGAERINGYSAEEIVGEHISEFYSPMDRSADVAGRNLEQAKNWGRHESEGWRVRKDGKRFWANTILQAIRGDHGELLGFAEITRDTTERKKILNELHAAKVKAERAAVAKSDFLANMSHEIRTPLTGIMGYSRLALEYGHMSNTVRSYVERAYDASGALRIIIDDILDFSKLEAGELRFEVAPFALHALINSCTSIVRLMAEEKGLELKVKIDAGVPEWVLGDPGRLRQVLLNLLNNAIKFTPNGHVELRLECASSGDAAVRLRFAVVDTGIGISEADQEKLFIRFSQADSSVARKYGGTGLGLAISKRIVEAMGGEVGLDSKRAVGSTFWFTVTLPIAEAPAEEVEKSKSHSKRHLHILMADDLEMNRELVKLLLNHAGHDVTVARDGAEAIKLARTHRYDLIFLDIRMPGMDGIEAVRRIRKLSAEHGDIPIVALTADVSPTRIVRYKQAGFTDHIPKPIDADELLHFVDRWAARLDDDLPAAPCESANSAAV